MNKIMDEYLTQLTHNIKWEYNFSVLFIKTKTYRWIYHEVIVLSRLNNTLFSKNNRRRILFALPIIEI